MIFRSMLVCAFVLAAGAARADTLVVCSEASPDALNAALSGANTSFDVTEQIADRLVEMEPGSSAVIPGLAESWATSPDGLRVTFKLRHGREVPVERQVEAPRATSMPTTWCSVSTGMLDKSNSYYKVSGGTYEMFNDFVAPALKSVTRQADDSVVFELNRPSASLISALTVQSFSIWPAEYAAAMLKAGTPEMVDQAPLGTGPFQLVQYQKDSLIRFRAFAGFWGKAGGMAQRAPGVDNLVFAITPDAAVRLAKLRANECQVERYPNPADIATMRGLPGIAVPDAPVAALSMLSIRTDQEAVRRPARCGRRWRRAIDLDSLVAAVFQGSGTPSAALVPTALWGHNDQVKPYPYDPARARALLAEAGYPDGFSTDLWAIPVTRAYMPNGRRAAELIQADWAKIGVKANIVTFEWGEYLRRRREGEASVAMNGGTWDYPDPSEEMQILTLRGDPERDQRVALVQPPVHRSRAPGRRGDRPVGAGQAVCPGAAGGA